MRNKAKKIFKNLKEVLTKPKYIILFLVSTAIFAVISFWFFQYELIVWNNGFWFTWTEIILQSLISILFWLFITWQVFKYNYFKQFDDIWNDIKGWIWWFLWVLLTGCTSCSIWIATYIWLWSVLSLLPWHWLELKILSLWLLLWTFIALYSKLLECKIKKNKVK